MRARLIGAAAIAIAGYFTLGCNGITSPSNNTVEPFSGTLEVQSAKAHPFKVAKTGEYTVFLRTWTPNANLLVGLALVAGASDGITCTTSIYQQNNFASLNAQALGGQIISGNYCVVIYDVGTLTATQNYTVAVSHP